MTSPLINKNIIYTAKPKLSGLRMSHCSVLVLRHHKNNRNVFLKIGHKRSDLALEVYVCHVRVGFPVKLHYVVHHISKESRKPPYNQ